MKKTNLLFIILMLLFISCTSKEVIQENSFPEEKLTVEYANSLIERGFENLLVNDKVSLTKTEVDTLLTLVNYIDNDRILARTYRLKGLLHGTIKDFEKSNYYLDKADSIFSVHGEIADRSLIANYKVMLMRGYSKKPQMEKILLNGFKLANSNNNLLGKLHLTHELSVFYGFDLKDYQKCIYYGEMYFNLEKKISTLNNVDHFEEFEHKIRIRYSYVVDLILSTSYIALGEPTKSEKHLDKILPFVKSNDQSDKLKRIHLDYLKIYQSSGDTKKFNHHLNEYIKTTKKYNEYLIKKSNEALRLNLEAKDKLLDLQLLKKELEVNKTLKNKNNVIKKLLIMAVILGVIALFYFFKRTLFLLKLNKIIDVEKNNSQQVIRKLKIIIKKRNELESKITNIQNAIAQDLHDNFGNRLTTIISTSEVLKDILQKNNKKETGEFTMFLENLVYTSNQLMLDVKDLIWANDTKNNYVKEISIRFKNFINDFTSRNNIKIIYKEHIDYNYILPQLWNRQLLLVFKEALNNAYKHSGATLIRTGLEINDRNLKIYIIDNGKGFITQNVKKSGIHNIEKRVKSIDCKLIINSSKKKGTEIIITGYILNQDFNKTLSL